MKTTSLSFLAIATTFALQACAAPNGESTDAPANIDPASVANANANDQVETPAAKLAGAFGAPAEATMQAGTNAALVNQEMAGSTAKTQLFVKSTQMTYDVDSYDFGVYVGPTTFTSGMRESARPTLMPLTLTMKANPFAKEAVLGTHLDEIILRRVDVYGKAVDIASFKEVGVLATSASAAGNDGVINTFVFDMSAISIRTTAGSVSYDAMDNTSAQNLGCTGDLPGFVQSTQSSDVIAKGSVRVDAVAVNVSGSPASLDGISVSGSVANMGLCAFYDAVSGKGANSARIAVSAQTQSTWKPMPRESTTWEACYANVSAVSFSNSYDGSPSESVVLSAAGLVRTDRTFVASSGAEATSSSYGFSFTGQGEIKSCGELVF